LSARGRSRYYKYSIMSNSGFGSLLIRKNDIEIVIPQKYIDKKEGTVHKRVQALVDTNDIEGLRKKGIFVKTEEVAQ
jgi:hypothetical protein